MMASIDLNGDWSFAYCEKPPTGDWRSGADIEAAGLTVRPARVPGTFELDLQAAGVIDDPSVGMNCVDLRRFESCHVWYWRRFSADDRSGHDAFLVFEGIDCFADIFLNGQ